MIIIWLAALGATIVVALLVALAFLTARGKPLDTRAMVRWAAGLWVFNFLLDLALLYVAMPALTGPYWGMQWLLWPLLLTGVLALFGGSVAQARATLNSFSQQVNSGRVFSISGSPFGSSRRSGRVVDDHPTQRDRSAPPRTSGLAGGAAIVLVFVIAIAVNGVITVSTTWFDGNAKALAAIPKIQSEPKSATLPPTDVNHIVLVSRGVASYLGQQVLASSGQNLGSIYHTDRTEYTLQSIKNHLYWIAPLVYNNVWANIGHWESPGYVVVDAEDPNATPQLRTGYHLRYLPDAILNQDLLRHVYLSGYTNGDLVDPTLEVDDSWNPYFTISLMQPTRGFTGQVVQRVLLVDPQSGAIQNLAPNAVPAWVDRIIPGDTVADYLTWWGKYAHAPWFNPSGNGQQAPDLGDTGLPELVYNSVDKPVWLVPMTSSAASDNSSTGVVLFDTRDNTGRFYPITGIGVTANATNTFKTNPANIRNYDVSNVQLYSIYGEPTWVCTFVQENDYGQSFQAVGMVDARHLNGADVIMQPNKTAALAAYAQWLADHNVAAPGVTPTGNSVTLTGKVARVNAATQNGTTVYYLYLEGQTRIFTAGIALSQELPLVQPGDTVTVTFLDTGQSVVTLTAFDDQTIQVAAPTATPGATGTPAP
ncbi:MAG: hypothetical protein OJF49_002950 [Ktedonobacterales bacterium]|jgi:hypothetical protein|nr:MAG: hypothetical protein OJF49_002950 [Ktedonobacterales bacterium]